MPLQKITQQDRFYSELIRLQKQVDLLIRDYTATMEPDRYRKPVDVRMMDPWTGKPWRERKKKK
jgi:endoglucanase Acf2